MRSILSEKLITLAKSCPAPLYVVGGATRDFLAGCYPKEQDVDLCAPMDPDVFVTAAKACGFLVQAVYKNTGTVKLSDGKKDYEFTSFRCDKYVRGEHRPAQIYFTSDIQKDARRRDFKANAVYYDIREDKFIDPLGGIDDIQNKLLDTVCEPKKVFGEDGLRLMRLARQAAQTGFTPTHGCVEGAKANKKLILDIVPERIFAELCLCLIADEKYGVKNGHYRAFKMLFEIGVLEQILPELTLGDGMPQREDFHRYDVLEHSLRALLYADKSVRLAALLHDVAKPYCTQKDGNAHEHHVEGSRIATDVLTRWKAPKKLTQETAELVLWHMYDFNCQTKENKLRKFFVEHAQILEKLLLLKQADFSACKDDLSPCPTGEKWNALLSKMQKENAPLCLKQLAVNGKDLQTLGFFGQNISATLKKLLLHAALNPKENKKERLLFLAKSWL